VGAVDPPARVPVTIATDLNRIEAMIDHLLAPPGAEQPPPIEPVTGMLRHEVGRVHARFPEQPEIQTRLADWADALRKIATAGDPTIARAESRALVQRITADRPALEAAASGSLYDPARLTAWKASRRAR
jgi:hypothetical protein